jgi:energy-coupling factor transport system ATP-binding protein
MLAADRITVSPPGVPTPVLEAFSIVVAPGERVAVTGPIGCGKTSLALAVAGLIPVGSGTVTLDGRPLTLESPERRRIATILQEPTAQLTQPSVREEVEFVARNLGRPDAGERAWEWIERLGLARDSARPPLQLSAGRQQLVLIASGLAADPDYLVVDEGTAHLDPATRRQVLAEVGAFAARGRGVLWVTQLDAESQWADRTVEVRPRRRAEPASGEAPAFREAARWRIRPYKEGPDPRISVPREVEIPIPSRGVLGITGPNGSGKTILLEALAGMREHAQIVRAGGPAGAAPIMACQYPELGVFNEVVVDELAWAAVRRGMTPEEAIERATAILSGTGTAGLLHSRTWSLSAGERRLVHMISALVAPASLVLLDEPTCGVDESAATALGEAVRTRSLETGVVIATQDHDWLRGLAPFEMELGQDSSVGLAATSG